MNSLKYLIVNIVETLLRGFPISCKTGLIEVGNPNKNSPVLLTCNYHLTVERVKRALKGMDCYLLVAKSDGYNVWCGATGGHLNNHTVISVLKTSGIEELVDHRDLILPQLAATGIESRIIHKKTGWRAIWGPVYAKDIPAFIKNRLRKTPGMREVRFPLIQRIEMAAMWAFPLSIIVSLIAIIFLREVFLPLTILIWSLPFFIFLLFPLYSKSLSQGKSGMGFSKYTVIFDFSWIPLILLGTFLFGLVIYSILVNRFAWEFIFRWSLISFVIILLVSIDLMGSTPVYKSGLHEDRFLKIHIDEEKCRGTGYCEQVCPKNCYEIDGDRHIVKMPRAERCVQCGACIVQCPFDALYFEGPTGQIIFPETIRKFKLNLIGKRLVKVEG